MIEPLVSIIIPVYNVEAYLRECLNSVIVQTYPNWECILVDDSSTDSSAAIAGEFCAADSRFHLITHKANRGLSETRNSGIELSKGHWITFVDSDDFVSSDYVSELVKASSPDVDVVSSFFTGRGRDEVISPKAALSRILYQRGGIDASFCGKLFRRELFDGLRFTPGRAYEDLDLIDRVILRARLISLIPEQIYFYRQRPGSILHTWNDRRLDVLTVTAGLEERLAAAPELLAAARDRRFAANFNILLQLRKNGLSDSPEAAACRQQLRRLRREVLLNRRSRLKNRLGALLLPLF